MVQSKEIVGHVYKYGRAGLFSLAALLGACGSDSNDQTPPETTEAHTPALPTARQVALKEGGSVSQYPTHDEGFSGLMRYCVESGGEVTTLTATTSESEVGCQLGEVHVKMSPETVNDSLLDDTCKIAGGVVIQVAMTIGNINSVPACHTGKDVG